VIPALLRKIHEAKVNEASDVVVWGSGTPRREFMHADDAARACTFLMNLGDEQLRPIVTHQHMAPVVNVGCGRDITVRELAELIAEIVEFKGRLVFDTSKPDGTPRKLLDVSRLATLGWEPEISLEDGLRNTYQDLCANLPIVGPANLAGAKLS
jgi:GDP-L-fucose synthase